MIKHVLQRRAALKSEAFGSPIHCNARVTTGRGSEQRGVVESVRSMVCGTLFNESEELPPPTIAQCGSEVVELLDDECNVIEKGVVQKKFICGIELLDVKLCPCEVAVCVTYVVDGSKWVGELVGEFLYDCVGEIVHWRCIRVRSTELLEAGMRIREREIAEVPILLEFDQFFIFVMWNRAEALYMNTLKCSSYQYTKRKFCGTKGS